MKSHGARTGWRTLASTSWFLLLAGLSCKYDVTLPWVSPDAKATQPDTSPDTSFDLSSISSIDQQPPLADAHVCTGRTNEYLATRQPAPQIIVAIDRSASMQNEFDSGSNKTQAALSALFSVTPNHSWVNFLVFSFPGPNCGASTCCAVQFYNSALGKPPPDASLGCWPFDAGCPPPSKDSPSHSFLKQASTSFVNNTWWGWNSTLVIITDQNPSCAGESDNAACDSAKNYAVTVVEQGARIVVLVPNAEPRAQIPDCLNGIAKQNARNSPDAQMPILVKSQPDLRSRLETIAQEVEEARCRFYPSTDVHAQDRIEQVKINDETIPWDESGKTGWKPAANGIQLSPEACDKVPNGYKSNVKVVVCSMGYGPGTYGN